ncbi:MAG: hypothetical protein CME59_18795 [Halioglobus sp.]|nr:hypothetical protein [Halioglobus sp.]|tara:strand:+ start:3928 stop:4632 length:705 start_codon:yes stop_codon:yes gene_type:complete
MIEFIVAQHNQPFAIAICLMLIIALLEGVGTVLGMGIFSFLDTLIPDFDADIDIAATDAGLDSLSDINPPETSSPNALSRILGWLRVGRVPLLMLLVIFLTSFGLTGYILQGAFYSLSGLLLPASAATAAALAGSIPILRVSALTLEKIMPNTESSAVNADSFIGKIAVITLGSATPERAAEAKLTDRYGQSHYVHVKPEQGHGDLHQGEELLLVRKEGSLFVAVRNNDDILSD